MGCGGSRVDMAATVEGIHDVLRINLTHLTVFAEVAAGNDAKAHKYRKMTPEFAKYARDVLILTHQHHAHEDDEFFPWLLNQEALKGEAKKQTKLFIKRLSAEHRVLEKELTACEKYVNILLGKRTQLQMESDKRRRQRAGPMSEWQYEYIHLHHHANNVVTMLFPHLRAEEEYFNAEWVDEYCPEKEVRKIMNEIEKTNKAAENAEATLGLLRFSLKDEQLDLFGITGCLKCCIIPCCLKEHYHSSAPFLHNEVDSKVERLPLSREWDVSELSEASKTMSLDEGSDYSSGGSDQEKGDNKGKGKGKGKKTAKKGKKKADSEEEGSDVEEEEEASDEDSEEEDTEEASSS